MNRDKRVFERAHLLILILIGLHYFLLMGCTQNRHMVLAATGTNIGVEISQNPATQSPQGKLGYQRSELAIVPTNRSTQDDATTSNSLGNGAADLADVVMELRYGGIFDVGPTSGIYQRLAVGKTAVQQPGASLMFAKNAGGEVTAEASRAIAALESVPAVEPEVRSSMRCLSDHRQDADKKGKIDSAIKSVTGDDTMTWDKFADSSPTPEQMGVLLETLKRDGINC